MRLLRAYLKGLWLALRKQVLGESVLQASTTNRREREKTDFAKQYSTSKEKKTWSE